MLPLNFHQALPTPCFQIQISAARKSRASSRRSSGAARHLCSTMTTPGGPFDEGELPTLAHHQDTAPNCEAPMAAAVRPPLADLFIFARAAGKRWCRIARRPRLPIMNRVFHPPIDLCNALQHGCGKLGCAGFLQKVVQTLLGARPFPAHVVELGPRLAHQLSATCKHRPETNKPLRRCSARFNTLRENRRAARARRPTAGFPTVGTSRLRLSAASGLREEVE